MRQISSFRQTYSLPKPTDAIQSGCEHLYRFVSQLPTVRLPLYPKNPRFRCRQSAGKLDHIKVKSFLGAPMSRSVLSFSITAIHSTALHDTTIVSPRSID